MVVVRSVGGCARCRRVVEERTAVTAVFVLAWAVCSSCVRICVGARARVCTVGAAVFVTALICCVSRDKRCLCDWACVVWFLLWCLIFGRLQVWVTAVFCTVLSLNLCSPLAVNVSGELWAVDDVCGANGRSVVFYGTSCGIECER